MRGTREFSNGELIEGLAVEVMGARMPGQGMDVIGYRGKMCPCNTCLMRCKGEVCLHNTWNAKSPWMTWFPPSLLIFFPLPLTRTRTHTCVLTPTSGLALPPARRFHHNSPCPLSFYRSSQLPQAERDAWERARRAREGASQPAGPHAPAAAAGVPAASDTQPELDQHDELEQLRAQLRTQEAISGSVQQGQERYKQACQQRQQQQQQQPQRPPELQPPSEADLAKERAAADAEAMSGPIGTGDPAGVGLSVLCCALALCVAMCRPVCRPVSCQLCGAV